MTGNSRDLTLTAGTGGALTVGSIAAVETLTVTDGSTVLATPDELKSASVTGKIIGQVKGPKINGYTYKRRTNQHRRYGHRQKYHLVEITSITV